METLAKDYSWRTPFQWREGKAEGRKQKAGKNDEQNSTFLTTDSMVNAVPMGYRRRKAEGRKSDEQNSIFFSN